MGCCCCSSAGWPGQLHYLLTVHCSQQQQRLAYGLRPVCYSSRPTPAAAAAAASRGSVGSLADVLRQRAQRVTRPFLLFDHVSSSQGLQV
jgi:hypothetical protein